MNEDIKKEAMENGETSLATIASQNSLDINSEETAAKFFAPDRDNAIWTSLDMTDKIGIAQAMGDADYNLRDFFKEGEKGATIEIVNALSHRVTLVDDEGIERRESRLVLIDKDGKTYSSVAKGAFSSLGNLFQIFGLPPYSPPLKIEAKEVKTRRGFYTLNIKPVR